MHTKNIVAGDTCPSHDPAIAEIRDGLKLPIATITCAMWRQMQSAVNDSTRTRQQVLYEQFMMYYKRLETIFKKYERENIF